MMTEYQWDVFISYSSEDRELVASPLARALQERGLQVWFDQEQLEYGDNLPRLLENGLCQSKIGVVILSASYFSKTFPQEELAALLNREIAGGGGVLLPVRYGLTPGQ